MSSERPRLVGINHVALEVGDLEAAVAFYGANFQLCGVEREPGIAFIDMGDQFLALSQRRDRSPDQKRHFGLVVDDKPAARAVLESHGAEILPGPRLDVLDPWGNRIQVVDYRDIQFTKAPPVLRGMGLNHLRKRASATRQLRAKGLASPSKRIDPKSLTTNKEGGTDHEYNSVRCDRPHPRRAT
jgi:catechol 2,3-dioxygenase-like lactoylglutathione lyase family enzyme